MTRRSQGGGFGHDPARSRPRLYRWLPWFALSVLFVAINLLLVFELPATSTDSEVPRQVPWQAADHKHVHLKRPQAPTRTAESFLLTIFTVLKEQPAAATHGATDTYRAWAEFHTVRMAIRSWFALPVDILLYGDNDTCSLVASHMLNDVDSDIVQQRVRCEPFVCLDPAYHIPTYDCIFQRTRDIVGTPLAMYANSDILFFPDLIEMAREVGLHLDNFAVVGKRHDVRLPALLDPLNPPEAARLETFVRRTGVLHEKFGIDYFIFQTNQIPTMMPFLVGRVRWDNWLLAQYLRWRDAHSIDASAAVLAAHQSLMPLGESAQRPGSKYNVNLTLGTVVDPKKVGSIEQTDWLVVKRGPCPTCRTPLKVDEWLPRTNATKRHVQVFGADRSQESTGLPRLVLGDAFQDFAPEDTSNNQRAMLAATCEKEYGAQADETNRASLSDEERVAGLPGPILTFLHGPCKDHCCQLRRRLPMDLDAMLYAVEDFGEVVLLPTQNSTLALSLNWLCQARRIGISNIVLLALDQLSYRRLNDAGHYVLYRPVWNASEHLTEFANETDPDIRWALERTGNAIATLQTLYQLLRKQISVVLTRPDVLFLTNFLRQLDPAADIQGQADGTGSARRVASSLVRFSATNAGRDAVNQWLSMMAALAAEQATKLRGVRRSRASGQQTVGSDGIDGVDAFKALAEVISRRRPAWSALTSTLLSRRAALREVASTGPPVWPMALDLELLQDNVKPSASPSQNHISPRVLAEKLGQWLLTEQQQCRQSPFPLPEPPGRHIEWVDHDENAEEPRRPRLFRLDPTRGLRLTLIVLVGAETAVETLDNFLTAAATLDLSVPRGAVPWRSVSLVVSLPGLNDHISTDAAGQQSDAALAICLRHAKTWAGGSFVCAGNEASPNVPSVNGTLSWVAVKPPRWSRLWFPMDELDMGLFMNVSDSLAPTALQAIHALVNHTYLEPALEVHREKAAPNPPFRGSRALDRRQEASHRSAFDSRLYGLGLVTNLKAIPFAKKPAGLGRSSADQELLLWRYQRVLPSGMLWFGPAYAYFLTWFNDQWPRYQNDGWHPHVAGMKAVPPEHMWSWQNRFVAERGWYAAYAGPNLGPIVTPGSGMGTDSAATGIRKFNAEVWNRLPAVSTTPLYDIYANLIADERYMDGLAFLVEDVSAMAAGD